MDRQEKVVKQYKEQGPLILRWLKTQVGPESEDVLQDILLRALANLDALEPVRDLAAWFWRSARNRVIDLWRVKTRQGISLELEEIMDPLWEDAQDALDRRDILEALEKAMEGLPPAQREVVIAQGLKGETFASISARTGIPLVTLAARKRYGLEKIREALRGFNPQEDE